MYFLSVCLEVSVERINIIRIYVHQRVHCRFSIAHNGKSIGEGRAKFN